MKKELRRFAKGIRYHVSKKAPEILTGIGIASGVTTVVLAVGATPKALMLMEEEKNLLEVRDLTPKQVVKVTWRCYIPAAVTGAVSIACLIGAHSVHARRNAALATAYKLSETAFTEYKDKVVETFGEKKEQVVHDKVAKEHIEREPKANKEVYITGKGETLCFDMTSGRYFKSDQEDIRKAVNILNKRLMDEMYISLNEFYYEIGLRPTSVGNEIGWNLDDGLIEVRFSAQIADDGQPCIVIEFYIAPRYDYSSLH